MITGFEQHKGCQEQNEWNVFEAHLVTDVLGFKYNTKKNPQKKIADLGWLLPVVNKPDYGNIIFILSFQQIC
jgi:hypothetical protein